MGEVLKYGFLAIICAVLIFPVWLMVTNSFTPAMAFLRMPPRLIPNEFTLKNYIQAFRLPHLPRWIANTGILVAIVIVAGVLVNGAAGYSFAYGRFKIKQPIFWLMMAPIFVTRFVLLITQFKLVGILGLTGLPAVALMTIFWPTGIYLFRNYFKAIPGDFLETARIDGASEWRILTRVVLPLSKPIMGAIITFLGMNVLGDYIWQMLLLQNIKTRTYLVGLLQSTLDIMVVKNIGYDLTVGTLLFLPYLILFSFTSKYFIQSLTTGGLKE